MSRREKTTSQDALRTSFRSLGIVQPLKIFPFHNFFKQEKKQKSMLAEENEERWLIVGIVTSVIFLWIDSMENQRKDETIS